MKCRKNIRTLIQEFNATSAPNQPNTPLARLVQAMVALKSAPSRLASPHTQANRYDDYVYIHQQSMAGHANNDPGPHPGHKGPMFFPWHREFLRQFELDLRAVSGDSGMCLPYWDFSRDQDAGDAGYPFVDAFLGGDGTGPNDTVVTGPFTVANGFTVALGGAGVNAIQRQLGQSIGSLPSVAGITAALAVNSYDAPAYDWDAPATSSFRNLVEGWVGANIHNRVHVWVGGSMLPATSPNDPVFFLNHAKEDELWAVWSQKYPTVAHYLPGDSFVIPAAQHHLKRLSDPMEGLAEYFGAGTLNRPIDLLDNKAITWYDTDLPNITLESGPAIAFNDTPAGLTVAKKIRFRLSSCRPVLFSITGAPSGNFSILGGPDFPVNPNEANDSEILEIEVRFIGQGANIQVSAVAIQASIVDAEGYYAANPNDTFVVKTFHIELVASNIVTSDSSIVLVLDRSGSMADVANNGFTKNDLLKNAVGVVHELMKNTDEIGIARFDHEADVLLPMTLKSAGLGTTLTGSGLDPRGSTNIAGGILVGSGLINGPDATHPNKAMIVLTDGNDYPVPNTIATLPPGTINQTTFAIGLGLPGQVNDAALSQISANSGGYLLTTGDISNNDERFKLAKLFIQILKDATHNETIVDPEGQLLWNGKPQEIPFMVADSDVSIDVVALCPIPFALDFHLVTPGGQLITAATAGVEPNVSYHLGVDVAYYRLLLPALPSFPGDSHRGQWKAVISLRSPGVILAGIQSLVRDNRALLTEIVMRLREFAQQPTPYNLTVHSYSNLTLDAVLRQEGFAPGATLYLTANLWEYRLPLQADATVWADLVAPDGSRATLPLVRAPEGDYRAEWVTLRPGAYQFLVHAEGHTSGNARFTREKLLTAGVWAGGETPFDPVGGGGKGGEPGGNNGSGRDDRCCKIVLCLLEQLIRSPGVQERLKALGVDLNHLRRCFKRSSKKGGTSVTTLPAGASPATLNPATTNPATLNSWQTLSNLPEFQRLITALTVSGVEGIPFLQAPKTVPVKRRPRFEVGNENIFIRPGEKLGNKAEALEKRED